VSAANGVTWFDVGADPTWGVFVTFQDGLDRVYLKHVLADGTLGSLDAGIDAGLDAGVDAGVDAGLDAGSGTGGGAGGGTAAAGGGTAGTGGGSGADAGSGTPKDTTGCGCQSGVSELGLLGFAALALLRRRRPRR
jgi:uncharacterized protein (TIGR03382 family)